MNEQLIQYDTAVLAKEKDFSNTVVYFYSKPRSKMFGLDEKGRSYPIKNTPRKLYTVGEHAVLNIENVFEAPSQTILQKWLREVHKTHITIHHYKNDTYSVSVTDWCDNSLSVELFGESFKTYEEALEAGLFEALKLI